MQGARKTITGARYSSDVRGHTCVVVNKWIYFGAPASKVQSVYDLHLSLFTLTYTNNLIYMWKSRPLAVVNYSLYSCYTSVCGARKGCRDRNLAEAMRIAYGSSSGPDIRDKDNYVSSLHTLVNTSLCVICEYFGVCMFSTIQDMAGCMC
jgi:hypothetical protein